MSAIRVVIVAYGHADLALRALRSLEKHLFVPAEVVVWDNSPGEGLPELRDFKSPQFSYYRLGDGRNHGFGAAVNRAVAFDTGRAWTGLFLLNPDAELASPLDAALSRELTETQALFGFAVFDDAAKTRRQASARRFPNAMQTLFARESLLTRALPANSVSRRYLGSELKPDAVAPVDWVSGCALFAPRKVWERLGGFDERYFLYVEDVDLGREARHLGIPVLFFPKIHVVHEIRGSASSRPAFADYHHHRGMLLYHVKWSGWAGRALTPVVAAGIAARFLARRVTT